MSEQVTVASGATAPGVSPASSWGAELRATFTLGNILNARQKVRGENGETPVRYQPAYLDPLGRTVGITIRKLWL